MTTFPDAARQVGGRMRRRVAVRHRLDLGVDRVRTSWWSIGQSALAGSLAWEAGVRLLHHPAPFFATVAAIVCLSISYLNRVRRVTEMALGVTLGVSLGDLLVHQIGRGGWQLGLVVLLAMSAALLLDGGNLIVNQAALQAVFVTVLPPPEGGYLGRWQDALLGGAVALTVAFVLPADPRPALRETVDDVVHLVGGALRSSIAAARAGDPDAAHEALEAIRATRPQLDRWRDAVRAGEETSRISPLRRRGTGEIRAHRRGLAHVDRAVGNLRGAARRMVAAVENDARRSDLNADPVLSGALLEVLSEVAGALYTLPGALRDPDGEGARRMTAILTTVAPRLGPAELGAREMSATVVVALLRSTVVDLLQVTGMPELRARALLPR